MCHVRTYSQSLLVPLGSLVSYEGWFAHVALHGEVNPVELKCTFLHVCICTW